MSYLRCFLLVFTCLDFRLICASLPSRAAENFTDVEPAGRILSRPKRYLIFPQGSNLQLVFCLTIGAYIKADEVVMGLTAALAWELPSTIDTKIPDLLHRRSRSVMFPKIESFLQATGLDGRSCVMRALCEAAQRNSTELGKGTLVQEILHAVFSLPRDGGSFERPEDRLYDRAYETSGDCGALYPGCQHSIYAVDF